VKSQRKNNNVSTHQSVQRQTMAATARALFGAPGHKCLQKMTHAIMNTGATAIFIMEGTPIENKRIATKPLTINLPNGTKIKSTHCGDITIPGLPEILTGNIVPSLSIASLIRVRVLCNAECTVTFSKKHCDIIYNYKTILQGFKDPTTDLWTIPINAKYAPPHTQDGHPAGHSPAFSTFCPLNLNTGKQSKICTPIPMQPNDIHALQSDKKGFLKGCPNISEKLILKYLNPSLATAKGHMKQPRQGIRSTTPKK
jgi:hypothetical protein